MKTLHIEDFSTARDLTDFINQNGIRKEDVLSINGGGLVLFTLFYYK